MTDTPQEQHEDRGFRRINFAGTRTAEARTDRTPDAGTVVCETCNDARWLAVRSTVPGEVPALIPCRCHEERQAGTDARSVFSELEVLSSRTFDTLDMGKQPRNADAASFRNAVVQAKRYAEQPVGWLVLSGPVLSGKTHIAAAIANKATELGNPVRYISAFAVPDMIRGIDFGRDAEDAETRWQSLLDAPVLILDDFGAGAPNARTEGRLDLLLTHRATQGSPTVVVLARPLEQLAERFRDRLADQELCALAEIHRRVSSDDVQARGRLPRSMLQSRTFDNFDASGAPSASPNERASLSLALAAARRFAANPVNWLYLAGPTGVGKTHLAVAIAGQAEKQGLRPTFWRVPDLLDRLRNGFETGSKSTFYDQFMAVKESHLLILDDFGSHSATDWSIEKLYELICHRSDRALPTVITTQYMLWEGLGEQRWRKMEQLSLWESLRSRLEDSSIVADHIMSAPDYRRRGTWHTEVGTRFQPRKSEW